MKILVLGGDGYIGSALYDYLKAKGLDVYSYGNRCNDYNGLSKAELALYEYIILLAGHSSVKMCDGDLSSPWNNNIRNFGSLVKKLGHNHKLIYASSSSVYGNNNCNMCKEEESNLSYVNNYDLTKITLDLLATNNINSGGSIVGLRFGTVNGPSSVLRKDVMINSMVHSAINNGHITVANKDVYRPILGINDLVYGIYKIIISRHFTSGIYNLASFNTTVDKISKTVSERLKVDIIDKGITEGCYDFKINCDYFKSVYNFEFNETIESIVDRLVCCFNYDEPEIVSRDKYFEYRGN